MCKAYHCTYTEGTLTLPDNPTCFIKVANAEAIAMLKNYEELQKQNIFR